MIWLTWRQFRTNAWVTLAALAALAVAYLMTGPHLFHAYTSSGLAACSTGCDNQITQFKADVNVDLLERLGDLGIAVMFLLPVVVGVFWGAPLIARELESGTYRLVWNQSVTRTRWLAVKLLGLGAVAVGTTGLFSLLVSWWAGPLDRVALNRMLPAVFAARGIVPIGYAAFAFVLGVTVGVLVRRTVPAMAITFAIVALALVAMPLWVRPHLVTPVTSATALEVGKIDGMGISDNGSRMVVNGRVDLPGAWVLSNRTINPDGTPFDGPANREACNRDSSPQACMRWIASLGLREQVTFQPASRFWTLQWIETGVFLVLAALLAGFCFVWLRPRRN
jgi:ABC-type transport system involved in multi-copper enzyme maturation permease subunit